MFQESLLPNFFSKSVIQVIDRSRITESIFAHGIPSILILHDFKCSPEVKTNAQKRNIFHLTAHDFGQPMKKEVALGRRMVQVRR